MLFTVSFLIFSSPSCLFFTLTPSTTAATSLKPSFFNFESTLTLISLAFSVFSFFFSIFWKSISFFPNFPAFNKLNFTSLKFPSFTFNCLEIFSLVSGRNGASKIEITLRESKIEYKTCSSSFPSSFQGSFSLMYLLHAPIKEKISFKAL